MQSLTMTFSHRCWKSYLRLPVRGRLLYGPRQLLTPVHLHICVKLKVFKRKQQWIVCSQSGIDRAQMLCQGPDEKHQSSLTWIAFVSGISTAASTLPLLDQHRCIKFTFNTYGVPDQDNFHCLHIEYVLPRPAAVLCFFLLPSNPDTPFFTTFQKC